MAKIRVITKRSLTDVSYTFEDIVFEDGKQYDVADKILSTNKDALYCYYWSDSALKKGNGYYTYPIDRDDVADHKKYVKNEHTIVGSNQSELKFWGTKYDAGCISKVVYNDEYRYIKIYFYNKYRKKDDMSYYTCWGQYSEETNKMNFLKDLERILAVMAQ